MDAERVSSPQFGTLVAWGFPSHQVEEIGADDLPRVLAQKIGGLHKWGEDRALSMASASFLDTGDTGGYLTVSTFIAEPFSDGDAMIDDMKRFAEAGSRELLSSQKERVMAFLDRKMPCELHKYWVKNVEKITGQEVGHVDYVNGITTTLRVLERFHRNARSDEVSFDEFMSDHGHIVSASPLWMGLFDLMEHMMENGTHRPYGVSANGAQISVLPHDDEVLTACFPNAAGILTRVIEHFNNGGDE